MVRRIVDDVIVIKLNEEGEIDILTTKDNGDIRQIYTLIAQVLKDF